jgi:hypothetical protein
VQHKLHPLNVKTLDAITAANRLFVRIGMNPGSKLVWIKIIGSRRKLPLDSLHRPLNNWLFSQTLPVMQKLMAG